MRLGAFITMTRPEERGDLYTQCLHQARQFCDVVTVIDGESSWPQEFSWELIGHHFQAGYASTEADWVLHLDADFIIHENDFGAIRDAIERHDTAPALSMYKHQFILPDRYNLKSRLVTLVNKAVYGDRIRFDSGGDLCQPSLDGEEIKPDDVPETKVPIWNYEKLIKTKEQVTDDVGRMARAYAAYFEEFKLGGPDDESALREWVKMTTGRFQKPQRHIPLSDHPKIMQPIIANLTPEQWGHSGWGMLPENDYA